MRTVNVELTIKDYETGEYLVVPVVPERVEYADGDKKADVVDIINLGDVAFPSGVNLDSLSWASFFPGRYDPGYCATSNLKEPTRYRNIFSTWKDKGTKLQLICPAAGINKKMYLRTFTWDLRGFEGDINYSIEFEEVKEVRPRKASTSSSNLGGKKAGRSKVPKKSRPKTYTVVRGDYLIKIAKKHGIKDWRGKLYEPNRGVIGSNPDLIYPGQKLKLP